MKSFQLLIVMVLSQIAFGQKNKIFKLLSPDGKLEITVNLTNGIEWTARVGNDFIVAPSLIKLTLNDGEILGKDPVLSGSKYVTVNTSFATPLYKKSSVKDEYNELMLNFKKDFGIIFRVYDEGIAYRLFTNRKGELIIHSDDEQFNFDKNYKGIAPYVHDPRNHDRFMSSFESLYDIHNLKDLAKDTLAFLPLLIDLGNNRKVVITEADLQNFPGMYLTNNNTNVPGLNSVFAPYPLEETLGGIEYLVTKRADYIAKINGVSNLPWRVVILSRSDKDLANNDMIQRLAAPNQLTDFSWVHPGKVAWDWWNDWNISHVDFKAGVNTLTYKYYIDFASSHHLEYIIMDEGWSDDVNLMNVKPSIDLKEIIEYGKQKGVGVILWATWYAVRQKMDEAFAKYSSMGIKGFKIDFFDRDDQVAVASTYEIAKSAAKYKLMVDYHGMFKPAGLQRTYPNVIGFEGVRGMENAKWAPDDDVPLYDVTLPFIRMVAGPMDYTPGAMRNATKKSFRPINSMPMSQGTRCHQLAMYVVFESPLGMLADNPTTYMKEEESAHFISDIPTTFDETIALDGNVGSYISIARKKENTWYLGSMGNWDTHEILIDFSFLGQGNFDAEIFKDGINADRDATDYKREVIKLTSKDQLKVHLAPGGGWAAIVKKL